MMNRDPHEAVKSACPASSDTESHTPVKSVGLLTGGEWFSSAPLGCIAVRCSYWRGVCRFRSVRWFFSDAHGVIAVKLLMLAKGCRFDRSNYMNVLRQEKKGATESTHCIFGRKVSTRCFRKTPHLCGIGKKKTFLVLKKSKNIERALKKRSPSPTTPVPTLRS